MKSISPGVYLDSSGVFWARPTIHRRRTWRKLDATQLKFAIKEAATKDWSGRTDPFRSLAEAYLKARCPNKRLEGRPMAFTEPESTRVAQLIKYFGNHRPDEIRMPALIRYQTWRLKAVKKGTGERTVDLELTTLSNILNYGVATGRLDFNYIRNGRPRFRKDTDVQHARDKAPANAEALHATLATLFQDARSESSAWQACFAFRTGCRTSELLKLRIDAKTRAEPGFIEGDHLFLARSKGGVNPYVLITPDFREMLDCFLAWHRERYPADKASPWYFPGKDRRYALAPAALAHALRRLKAGITPHGLRAYYVTKRRSDGASDSQIAAEIGDKTVALIQQTYGDLPPNWKGGDPLTWVPKEGKPAWAILRPS